MFVTNPQGTRVYHCSPACVIFFLWHTEQKSTAMLGCAHLLHAALRLVGAPGQSA